MTTMAERDPCDARTLRGEPCRNVGAFMAEDGRLLCSQHHYARERQADADADPDDAHYGDAP